MNETQRNTHISVKSYFKATDASLIGKFMIYQMVADGTVPFKDIFINKIRNINSGRVTYKIPAISKALGLPENYTFLYTRVTTESIVLLDEDYPEFQLQVRKAFVLPKKIVDYEKRRYKQAFPDGDPLMMMRFAFSGFGISFPPAYQQYNEEVFRISDEMKAKFYLKINSDNNIPVGIEHLKSEYVDVLQQYERIYAEVNYSDISNEIYGYLVICSKLSLQSILKPLCNNMLKSVDIKYDLMNPVTHEQYRQLLKKEGYLIEAETHTVKGTDEKGEITQEEDNLKEVDSNDSTKDSVKENLTVVDYMKDNRNSLFGKYVLGLLIHNHHILPECKDIYQYTRIDGTIRSNCRIMDLWYGNYGSSSEFLKTREEGPVRVITNNTMFTVDFHVYNGMLTIKNRYAVSAMLLYNLDAVPMILENGVTKPYYPSITPYAIALILASAIMMDNGITKTYIREINNAYKQMESDDESLLRLLFNHILYLIDRNYDVVFSDINEWIHHSNVDDVIRGITGYGDHSIFGIIANNLITYWDYPSLDIPTRKKGFWLSDDVIFYQEGNDAWKKVPFAQKLIDHLIGLGFDERIFDTPLKFKESDINSVDTTSDTSDDTSDTTDTVEKVDDEMKNRVRSLQKDIDELRKDYKDLQEYVKRIEKKIQKKKKKKNKKKDAISKFLEMNS